MFFFSSRWQERENSRAGFDDVCVDGVDGRTIQYVERDGSEQYWTMEHYPAAKDMEKKMKLLAYFRSYMRDNLIKAGASIAARDGDELIRLPYLRQWFRTSRAVVMHLTNGTLQVLLLSLNSILCYLVFTEFALIPRAEPTAPSAFFFLSLISILCYLVFTDFD